MKIILSAVLTALLAVSTLAMADDSVVAGNSNDNLGVPASALFLTEQESVDVRGKAWLLWQDKKAVYAECAAATSAINCTDHYIAIIDARRSYKRWRQAYDEDGEKWQARKKAASY